MSQNCKNCGASVFDVPLNRVNPLGEIGIFWCESCIEKEEPELHKNLKEDESDIEHDLKDFFYRRSYGKG